MRLVNVNYVKEGSILARPIKNYLGQTLLGEDVVLTKAYIAKLKELGYDMIFIKDDRFKDIEMKFAISEKTMESAFQALRVVTSAIEANKEAEVDAEVVKNAVENIIKDLLHSTDILSNLSEMVGYDTYTYYHSINTTVIALFIGIKRGLEQDSLLELGMGVLMHDIGKTKISKELLNKKEALNQEDFEEIKKHTIYGYEVIKRNHDFSLHSAHVSLQHHEKWQGGGYPRGLKGKDIHEFGRIAAVADVYEALTSKRPYRDAMEPYLAYEYIVAQSGWQFDPEVVDAFVKSIAVYPTGIGVELSNGMRGNVIRQNPDLPNRPVVRVIGKGDQEFGDYIDYDLAKHNSLMITKVIYM